MRKRLERYLVLPRTEVSLGKRKFFYLAGPVRGGGNWQKGAIAFLRKLFPEAYFGFPCGFRKIKHFQRSAVKGEQDQLLNDAGWRRAQMGEAALHGCLIFWLGPQDKSEEEDFSKVPYGWRASREEAEWAFRLFYNRKLRIVIGVHHSFPGHDEIVENLRLLFGANFPVYARLPDLLKAAAKMAK